MLLMNILLLLLMMMMIEIILAAAVATADAASYGLLVVRDGLMLFETIISFFFVRWLVAKERSR